MSNPVYRIVSLDAKTGRWSPPGSPFRTYDGAELAARGIVRRGAALEAQVMEIRADGGKILAKVGKDALGAVVVKKS